MAPGKFGLFKGRSREYQEQPSTENLLHSNSTDLVPASPCPPSPIPSTSRGFQDDYNGFEEFSMLNLDSDDEDESEKLPYPLKESKHDVHINYKPLPSTNATSTTTLDLNDEKTDSNYDSLSESQKLELATPDDATSIDAYSLQFDETSILSEDVKYCGATKKQKKNKEQQMKDQDMWQASNYQVLQHLLSRSGTLDEQIKWEAIATARGLCTLTATCGCGDCSGTKSPASVTDGDGGLGTAPLIGAVSVGCVIQ